MTVFIFFHRLALLGSRICFPTSCLEAHDLVVTLVLTVEDDLDLQMDPELVAVLEVEPNLALGDQKVDFDTNTVLEVAINIAETDACHRDTQADLERVGVEVTRDLFRVKERNVSVSGFSSIVIHTQRGARVMGLHERGHGSI